MFTSAQILTVKDRTSSTSWSPNQNSNDNRIARGVPRIGNSQIKKQPRKCTSEQFIMLENAFDENPYLTSENHLYLSRTLNMDERRVKSWFQNRRMKEKRMLRKLVVAGLMENTTAGDYFRIEASPQQTVRDSRSRVASDNSCSNDDHTSSSNGRGDSHSGCNHSIESREIFTPVRRPVFVDQPPVLSPWTPRPQPYIVPRRARIKHTVYGQRLSSHAASPSPPARYRLLPPVCGQGTTALTLSRGPRHGVAVDGNFTAAPGACDEQSSVACQ